ncbi:hypothetical protein GUITHDRAFT_164288 [Guillardia theta CCMP2712]|uniref:Uncharacterized protein n=1 Tax=Guillardia theta (strain CCMP2712) TaxID=905079 RepID=L1J0W8_GUITC|nr:hypothetical protein GUITHDRAFT_164288 [Guillardia theta CCMP2712]EKX41735.1 hypothetical protein GUITHDRAFT_164288 [Guillardia theta CCMP2712]|eukprot:XP_005828715.1 hypothetical protein GUITHDRAFT_164288 [Guillardia theta CCMP2712]
MDIGGELVEARVDLKEVSEGSCESEDEYELLRFEDEEEFCAAASACADLYFLRTRNIYIDEESLVKSCLDVNGQRGVAFLVDQRGSESEIVQDDTGGAVYDAAIVLSRFLCRQEAGDMQGKNVLELGAGPALVSMAASILVGEKGFWWGTPTEDIPEMRGIAWDYVLASDVAYDETLFAPLVEGLLSVFNNKTVGYLCNGVRSIDREKNLRAMLEKHFKVESIKTSEFSYSIEDLSGISAPKFTSGQVNIDNKPLPPGFCMRKFHRAHLLWKLTLEG